MPCLEGFFNSEMNNKQPNSTLITSEFGPNMSEIFSKLLILKGQKQTF